MSRCSVFNCNSAYHAKGYCHYHYNKMIRNNNPPCKLCDQPRVGKGYCQKHYKRLNKTGDPTKSLTNREHDKFCSIEGCNKKYNAKGMCESHYMHYYSLGNRKIVISHYTNGENKCQCCGESIFKFLTMDHINNDGAKHRQEGISSSIRLINWLIKNNFPEGFQVLCFNCNCGKIDGICPHKLNPEISG